MLNVGVLANRARLENSYGRPEAALKYFEQAMALARELQGARSMEIAELLMDKAGTLTWLDELEQAEDIAREAVDMYAATVHRLHPNRILALSTLGQVLLLRHKLTEASAVIGEALAAERKVFGEYSRRVINDLDSLAGIAKAQHRLDDAEALVRQALDRQIKTEGSDHFRTGFYRSRLGIVQLERGKFAEAEAQLRASLAVFASAMPPDHPYVGASDYYLGEVMLATNRPKEAEAFFRAAIDITQRAHEPKWRRARSTSGLGEALYRQGRADEAETYLVDSYRVLASDPDADEAPRVASRERLVRFYIERAPASSGELRVHVDR